MDKMSREETLQAMKTISAQYGDNVIVEFSGDGLAALVESKKGALDNNDGWARGFCIRIWCAAASRMWKRRSRSPRRPPSRGMISSTPRARA